MIQCNQVTFKDVLAVFRLLQKICSAAADHVNAVIDEALDRRDQAQFAGLAVHHREQNHAEALLHRGVLEELVQHELRLAATLQFDDDTHAVAVGFVADIRDIFNDFVVHQLRHAFDELGLVHLVRNFSNYDGLAIFGEIFNRRFGAHHEAAASGSVGFKNSTLAVNDAGCGEIGPLYEFQNLGELGGGVVDQRNRGIHDFGQIMRRDVSRHAHGDAV